MQWTPLIELTRGGLPECLHFGAVAVVNTQGRVMAQVGDPHTRSFTRSTIKPFQALPFLLARGHEYFGLRSEQIALLCASHNGEAMHVAQVETILSKAGLGYKTLGCGCHVPLRFTFTNTAPPPGLEFDERHHNCSGKHSGFLAYCVQHGLPTANYLEPSHSLQQAVRRRVAQALGMAEQDMAVGTDGCSAPNYALPLSRLAYGYAQLASGAPDTELGESFALLFEAMTRHPELVSGTLRNDLAFMQTGRGDWVSKVGADGVQVVASRSRAQAFALKVSDGNMTAAYAAAVEVMEQLGWLDAAQQQALLPWRAQTILSARGAPVGQRRAVFKLTFSAT